MEPRYCTSCFRDAIFYGEIFPDKFELIYVDGHFSIVENHAEIFRFPSKPPKDPCYNMTKEEVNAFYEDPNKWDIDDIYFNYVDEFRKEFQFDPQTGKEIVDGCMKIGYDPMKNGWIEYWIISRASQMIQELEGKGVKLPLVDKVFNQGKENVLPTDSV
jgi:hypothetical protein